MHVGVVCVGVVCVFMNACFRLCVGRFEHIHVCTIACSHAQHSSLSAWFNGVASLRQTIYNVLQVIVANNAYYVSCPTGYLLGPLLFILYINDQSFCQKSKSILFADDTTVHMSGQLTNNLYKDMNRKLEVLAD